ncbi:BQ2448_1023 [Microbotryum intermedium]|uniref:BQ2448_1023 protein n=1 Tax=Microbotryum intermedium TaxID=269621 RepID=A0A238F4J3_9BASI|nr:BQ2448_1023 [Microbotryum intermedium]
MQVSKLSTNPSKTKTPFRRGRPGRDAVAGSDERSKPPRSSSTLQHPRPHPSTHSHTHPSIEILSSTTWPPSTLERPIDYINLCSSESDAVVDHLARHAPITPARLSRKELEPSKAPSTSADEVLSDNEIEEDEIDEIDELEDDESQASTSSTPPVEVDQVDFHDSCDDDSSESSLSHVEIEDAQTPSAPASTAATVRDEEAKEQKLIRVGVMYLLGKSKKAMQRTTGLSISKITKLLQEPSAGSKKGNRRTRVLEAAQEVFDREWDEEYGSSPRSDIWANSRSVSPPSTPSSRTDQRLEPPTRHPVVERQAPPRQRLVAYKYSERQLVTYYRLWLLGVTKLEAGRRAGIVPQSGAAFFWQERLSASNKERRRRIVAIAEKEAAKAKRERR